MKRLVVSAGIWIEQPSEEIMRAVGRECTFRNPKYDSAVKHSPYRWKPKIPEHITCWTIRNGGVIVPRSFPFWKYEGLFADYLLEDERTDSEVIWPQMQVEAFKVQRLVCGTIKKHIDHPSGSYLAVLPTSKGKTISALYTASRLSKRLLVIVDSNLIFEGWMRDVNKSFGLPSSEIGEIRGQTWKIGTYVTVAMRQTLMNRTSKFQSLWSSMGMVVLDEAHVMPCSTMTAIMDRCPCKIRMAITATDTRKDGLHPILYLYFGEPVIRQSIELEETRSSIPITDAIMVPTKFYAEYGEDYNKFLETLLYDPARNKLIVDTVISELAKGGVGLVLTTRREHAAFLREEIGKKMECDLALGASSEEEKKDLRHLYQKYIDGEGRCLVSTLSLIKKGANLPSLSRLFLVSPIANEEDIIQAAGRIRRKADGKKDAIIYLFYDELVGRIRFLVHRYHIPAFRKMEVRSWIGKYSA